MLPSKLFLGMKFFYLPRHITLTPKLFINEGGSCELTFNLFISISCFFTAAFNLLIASAKKPQRFNITFPQPLKMITFLSETS